MLLESPAFLVWADVPTTPEPTSTARRGILPRGKGLGNSWVVFVKFCKIAAEPWFPFSLNLNEDTDLSSQVSRGLLEDYHTISFTFK